MLKALTGKKHRPIVRKAQTCANKIWYAYS